MDNRDPLSDEVPVADAVEQEQETTPEPEVPEVEIPPIETNASDWQEQRQEVADEDDRDFYRE
ncbi:hypothetical protein [Mycobacterium branderi]|uniref:Uncharacterized protein n=1 Tax=Mycobacterium branderi TaxID=43348 RepID=A0A7I7VZR9_9MYCO|nr:hypothetical protein [Mycobacterium branderi]MCV7233098.1 hypothetical protein [Mycobacterium branderi]ORA41193.1 hypothetical protein BST20_03455 [Mycobacterium branderi]BBZ10207.1 hypothetical protein MBRA_04020 [Mycobacterium branderi]